MTTTTHPGQSDAAAYVARHPDGVRAADLAAALGITEASARTYLSRLADAGHATRLDRGLYEPAGGEREPPGERNDESAETQQCPASAVTSVAERNSERNEDEASPTDANENATAPAESVVTSASNATPAAGDQPVAIGLNDTAGLAARCWFCLWSQMLTGDRCEACGARLDQQSAGQVQVGRDRPAQPKTW